MARGSSPSSRFDEYVQRLGAVLGHADRQEPLRAYLTGLLLPGDRKSVEPMAAKVDPRRVRGRHQSMHHFVASAPWDERRSLAVARDYALTQLERHGPVMAWVVDDTGMPKKGTRSVGVARQYCAPLGKEENCQVAVTLSLASNVMSVPAGYRLYLPASWTKDSDRRSDAGVPIDVRFQTKWEIAHAELDHMLADDLPRAPVVADAGYGVVTAFRDGITSRGLTYAVGVTKETTVWPPGMQPLPPKPYSGHGRRPTLLRRTTKHQPLSIEALARTLSKRAWTSIRWREGTRGGMQSRFALVRVRAAHRDRELTEARPIESLLIEWPSAEPAPTKYWLSSVPESASIDDLVRLVKIRWRIERDFQELKGELGLDHYEGRGWRGFHHHGVLCIAAYAFLAAERARLSPPEPLAFIPAPPRPRGFKPRNSSASS